MKMPNFILCLMSLVLGGAGAWIVGIHGRKVGLLDKPNERSSHRRPTPKGGGIGILAAFVLSSLVFNIPLGFWLSATFLGPQITQIDAD